MFFARVFLPLALKRDGVLCCLHVELVVAAVCSGGGIIEGRRGWRQTVPAYAPRGKGALALLRVEEGCVTRGGGQSLSGVVLGRRGNQMFESTSVGVWLEAAGGTCCHVLSLLC